MTPPTFLDMQQAKRDGATITIGVNGRDVPLGVYLAGLRVAFANPAATFKAGLGNWWPTTGAEIRATYRQDLVERIARRGGDCRPTVGANDRRCHRRYVEKIKRGIVRFRCRWCGSDLVPAEFYIPRYDRFCDADCSRAYNG